MTLLERGEALLAPLTPDEQIAALEYLQALADMASSVGRTQGDALEVWMKMFEKEGEGDDQ